MQTRLKIGGYQGNGSVHTKALGVFVDTLASITPDFAADLHIDVTQEGQTAASLFSGVRDGSYDICYMASGYLSADVPSLDLLDVPFSITDRERAYAALDGAVGNALRRDVRDLGGLQVLAYWDNGFRHVSNHARPIRTPADCGDLIIRTLNNESYLELLRRLGFRPIVADVKDLVAKVKSGEVDAQENPLTNLVHFGLHAYHRHVSLTSHIFGVALFVANADWWDSLDDAGRDAVSRAARAATEVQRQASIDDDVALLDVLRRDGVTVLTADDIDMDAFRAASAACIGRLRDGLPDDLCAAYLQA